MTKCTIFVDGSEGIIEAIFEDVFVEFESADCVPGVDFEVGGVPLVLFDVCGDVHFHFPEVVDQHVGVVVVADADLPESLLHDFVVSGD